MITDARLFEDEHIPPTLPHRDGELEALSRAFEPILYGNAASDILLSGPSGVGKTVLSRFALQQLRSETAAKTAHVRCLGCQTGTILRRAVRELSNGRVDPAHNTPVDDVVAMLRETISGPTVIVLDEADDVCRTDAPDRLARLEAVSTIVICHDDDRWLTAASSSTRERLHAAPHLELERYRVTELADILERRAELGLRHGAVRRDQLEHIADHVAGVARFGIQALRSAAELAEERGHDRIRGVDVDDSFDRARDTIRAANLSSLPFAHLFIYELVRSAGGDGISSTELYERYDDVADEAFADRPQTPPTRRTRRDHLEKLRQYDLIETAGGVHRALNPDLDVPDEAAVPSPLIYRK